MDEDGENVYDNHTELVVVDDCRFIDLVVSDWIGYDDALLIPGGVLPMSFEVMNNSREDLPEVTARVGTQVEAAGHTCCFCNI